MPVRKCLRIFRRKDILSAHERRAVINLLGTARSDRDLAGRHLQNAVFGIDFIHIRNVAPACVGNGDPECVDASADRRKAARRRQDGNRMAVKKASFQRAFSPEKRRTVVNFVCAGCHHRDLAQVHLQFTGRKSDIETVCHVFTRPIEETERLDLTGRHADVPAGSGHFCTVRIPGLRQFVQTLQRAGMGESADAVILHVFIHRPDIQFDPLA